jgi:hypothetical protein
MPEHSLSTPVSSPKPDPIAAPPPEPPIPSEAQVESSTTERARLAVEQYWKLKSERYQAHMEGPCVSNEELTRHREAQDRAIDKHLVSKQINHQRWFTAEELLKVRRSSKDGQKALFESLGALEPDDTYRHCMLLVEKPLGSGKFELIEQ